MMKRLKEEHKVFIFSLLAAFCLWIFVMERMDPVIIRSLENVKIKEIVNIKELKEKGLVLSSGQDLSVSVDFRAKRSILLNYIRTVPDVNIRVEKPVVGDNTATLLVDAPSGVEYSFEPKTFTLKLEESAVSEKNIDIHYEGTPKENFLISQIHLSKQKAYVEGAKDRIDKVAKLTGTIDVEGVSKDYSIKARIIPVDADGTEVTDVTVDTDYTIVDVKVDESKEVPVKVRLVNSENKLVEDSSLLPSVEKVTIYGPSDKLDAIQEIATKKILVHDYNQDTDKEFELQAPEGIRLSTQQVKLIEKEDQRDLFTLEIPSSQIVLTGTKNVDKIKKILPPSITVALYTNKDHALSISEKDVQLLIDNTIEAQVYPIRFKAEYPVSYVTLSLNEVTITKGE